MVILVRRGLLICEDIIHLIVAAFLLFATAGTLIYSFYCFKGFTAHSILTLISNALLILIIKEVLWTVIKFFKREPFSISSFLFIGVISSIRQILFLEVQKSFEGNHSDLTKHALELGINSGVILILTISYFIVVKADQVRKENKK
jgi:uncharacterized membrane protein (DUF373 family)